MHSSSQKCWVQTIYTCNISHLDIHVFTHSVFISPLCLLCKSVTFIVQYHTLDLIMRNQHKLRASARLSPFISPGPYNVPWITLHESQMTSINNWVFFSYLVNYNFVKNMLLTVIWMCDCCWYFPGLLEKIICVHKRLSLVLSTEKLNLKFSTNKNKRHYGKVWNLFLIVQLIFFLSDSVFTHPFNTKRLYMYLFLYWILIKKTIQTFSQWPPRRSRASNILLVQKINYKGTIVQKHDLDLSEWVKMIHKNRYTSHQSYAFQTSRDPPLMPWQYWQGTFGFLHFVDTICSRITFCNHESPMIHTLSFMPITTQHQMLCEIRTHIKYLSLGISHTAKHQVECRSLNTWSETLAIE